jgi:hypothetical protein
MARRKSHAGRFHMYTKAGNKAVDDVVQTTIARLVKIAAKHPEVSDSVVCEEILGVINRGFLERISGN